MESLTGRTRLASLYRMTIPPGSGGLHRLDSMTCMRRGTRRTIMARTTRLTRKHNTTRNNRLPGMIRLTNHPGKTGNDD